MEYLTERLAAGAEGESNAPVVINAPQPSFAKAVALVVSPHHPVVLHNDWGGAGALARAADKVVVAIREKPRVHHSHSNVRGVELGEDLIEGLLVVLFWMVRLVLEHL
eukprot:scaffold211649_cov34-Tisochrysis_lutea.AAC.3